MSKILMLMLIFVSAIMLGCGSSSSAKNSVDDAVDDANDTVDDEVQSLADKVPTLDGDFSGQTVTSTQNLPVDVVIAGSSLKFDLSDGTTNFPVDGTLLLAVSSSGKKLLSSGKIDVDYEITTSEYWGFKAGDTIKGILELDGDNLKLDFNWFGNGRPTNFTESDWACEATRQ